MKIRENADDMPSPGTAVGAHRFADQFFFVELPGNALGNDHIVQGVGAEGLVKVTAFYKLYADSAQVVIIYRCHIGGKIFSIIGKARSHFNRPVVRSAPQVDIAAGYGKYAGVGGQPGPELPDDFPPLIRLMQRTANDIIFINAQVRSLQILVLPVNDKGAADHDTGDYKLHHDQ